MFFLDAAVKSAVSSALLVGASRMRIHASRWAKQLGRNNDAPLPAGVERVAHKMIAVPSGRAPVYTMAARAGRNEIALR